MNSFQDEEIALFVIEAVLTLFTTMLITVLLPKMYHGGSVRTVSISIFMGIITIGTELLFVYILKIYWDNSFRVHKLGWATLAFAIFGTVVGFVTSIWYRSKIKWMYLAPYFALVYVFGAWVSVNVLPILIQVFVYPTETITIIGFIMIYVATVLLYIKVCFKKPIVNNASKKRSKKTRICCKTLAELIFNVIGILLPTAISLILFLYLLLLRLLQESPTSHLTQTLLAFLPTVVAVIIGYFIEKKSRNKLDPPTEEDPTHTEDTNSPDNNPNDTTSEDEQPGDEQPRTGEMAGAESNEESQELQVEVEVHQSDSNSSDQSIIESTV